MYIAHPCVADGIYAEVLMGESRQLQTKVGATPKSICTSNHVPYIKFNINSVSQIPR